MTRFFRSLLFGAMLLVGVGRGEAHNAPGSLVVLDFHADHVGAELRLPLSELELAFGTPLLETPATVVERLRGRLTAYVAAHVTVRARDGRPWRVTVGDMAVQLADEPIDLLVRLELRPPDGAELRYLSLHYDVIAHEVMNHIAVVSVRSDWNNARLGEEPEIVGALRSFSTELVVERAAGSVWRGFRQLLAHGMHHIADGTDHLLFLLVLLLPAPLVARAGRWDGVRPVKPALRALLLTVSAFTVGHSVTLLAGALAWLRLPIQPVEIAVAASILVSAVHAWRPFLVGREVWVAGVFGLVHGLAFASTIDGLGLQPARMALAILAFNLGIEAMQLAIVAAVMPWFFLLARTGWYARVRVALAMVAGLAASGWVVERITGESNVVGRCIEVLATPGAWWLLPLAATAAGAWVIEQRRRRRTDRAVA